MVYSVAMIVYIEYAILDNMAMDMVLLYLVAITTEHRVRWGRLTLSSMVGTLCALAVPLVAVAVGYILKCLCVFAMCLVAYGSRKLPITMLLLVSYTFLLGGVLIGLLSLFGVQYSIDNMTCSYYSSVPIGIYIIAVVLCVVLVFCVVHYIQCRHTTSSAVVDIVLVVGGEYIACTGYIDSGNLLVAEGLPVCFACGSIGRKLSVHIASAVISGGSVELSYATMAGSKHAVAVAGSIAMGSRVQAVLLCVNRAGSAHGCDVLVNYKLMEGDI